MVSAPPASSFMCRSVSRCVPAWSFNSTRQVAVSHVAPCSAAPMRSANSCHVSCISILGLATRGNVTMSLSTGILRSTRRAGMQAVSLPGNSLRVGVEASFEIANHLFADRHQVVLDRALDGGYVAAAQGVQDLAVALGQFDQVAVQ